MDATCLIFPSSAETFKVTALTRECNQVCIYVQSNQHNCLCPGCSNPSKRVHSYYTRKFRDVPAFGNPCTLLLKARKFYCLQDECPVKIFTERFCNHFLPYRRSTTRLHHVCLNLALQTGGKLAERIAKLMNIQISDTSLLRIVNNEHLPEAETPYALGIDDWAYKKRGRYGSILVNLENRRIIDILNDREACSIERWLKVHPGIGIITRDRYGNYIKGATSGAPQALQVTDRWHLLKNLGEAANKIITREYARMNKITKTEEILYTEPLNTSDPDTSPVSDGIRKQRFDYLKKLQNDGLSIKRMAKLLGMHRQTVKKYMAMQILPRKIYNDQGMVEQYFPYIRQRMQENKDLYLKTLWTELKERGYNGAYSTLSDALIYYGIRLGKKVSRQQLPNSGRMSFKPSKVAMIFLTAEEKLTDRQRELLQKVCEKSTELTITLSLIRAYRQIMTNKNGSKLKDWIDKAKSSGIKEMFRFAEGLLTDYAATESALSLPWSNGPVEGNVNKLKTIKRQMYGRASFELLRKRLVLAPA
ncbi:ISL3 family transposase [Dyadobacter flavalbus]|uniref:ISL3 family transposase n=3 Tax=Dyadobacter flavalbus TaxID=2579942 RepID=A0A5M8QBP3_9BACT|nr:ISL3 family transposase [Dyadobacter flavalbus]KAA6432236.1 ISL3 family transposase [Dyadobacter flavalbus]